MLFEENGKKFVLSSNNGDEGTVLVDLSKENRGAHLGHAMVSCNENEIIAFYPNCNAENGGHSGRGWMEYKTSVDGGETWSKGVPYEFSKTLYDLNIGYSSMSEKAILTDDGKILVFNLICDVSKNAGWEPFIAPTYCESLDNGKTWSKAKCFTRYNGRIYDVIKKDGVIYVLMQCTSNQAKINNVYTLFCSTDNGKTFFERSKLPFKISFHETDVQMNSPDHFYGSLEFLPNGNLIAYIYNENNEYALEYCVSDNEGRTFSEVNYAIFKNRIRNPQIINYNGVYFAFGRNGNYGEDPQHFIAYTSTDGINWSDGQIIRRTTAGIGSYSNVIKVKKGDKERLLVMASQAYKEHLTNIHIWWIDEV